MPDKCNLDLKTFTSALCFPVRYHVDVSIFFQDWKTERYKAIIKSGTVETRPGVLRLMDETKAAGKKLAVCSAATKSSVILCLENLIGLERFQSLDCFLADTEFGFSSVEI